MNEATMCGLVSVETGHEPSYSKKQSVTDAMSTSLTFVLQHEIRHVGSVVARQDGDLDHVTLRDVDEILARVGWTPGGNSHVVPVGRVDRFTDDRQGATHGRVQRPWSTRRRCHGDSAAAASSEGEVE